MGPGDQSAQYSVGATVSDATPNITGVSPSSWNAGTSTTVYITGTGFGTNPSLSITDPAQAITFSVSSSSDTQIVANVTVAPSAPPENATITVTSQGYNGFGFVSTAGNSSTSPSATAPIISITLVQSPATLNMSSGDQKDIVVTVNPPGSHAQLVFVTGLSSNPNSSSTASVTAPSNSNATGTINYLITVSGTNSPSGIFGVLATANGHTANQATTVTVPPQVLIQVLYGEGHGQAAGGDTASEPALGAAIKNRFGRSEFPGG